jgi:hypothetical protein
MASPTKAELLEALRASGDEVVAQARALAPERFDEGRYENGWNARQILAHMASIEWAYPRLVDLARQAPAAQAPPSSSGATYRPPMSGGGPVIDDYNARQVAKRDAASVPELLEEFRKNRAATIDAVQAADDELFSRVITSAGGANGPLADVIRFVAVDHVRVHLRDLTGAAS